MQLNSTSKAVIREGRPSVVKQLSMVNKPSKPTSLTPQPHCVFQFNYDTKREEKKGEEKK